MKMKRLCVNFVSLFLLWHPHSLSAQTFVGAGVGGSHGFENFIESTTPLIWHVTAANDRGERLALGVAFTRLESPFVVDGQPGLIRDSSISVIAARGLVFFNTRRSPIRAGALAGFGWMWTRLQAYNGNVGKTNQPTIELGGLLQTDNTRRVIGRIETIYTRALTQYAPVLNVSGPAYWTVSGGVSVRVGR